MLWDYYLESTIAIPHFFLFFFFYKCTFPSHFKIVHAELSVVLYHKMGMTKGIGLLDVVMYIMFIDARAVCFLPKLYSLALTDSI